jgi:hypothetical protein
MANSLESGPSSDSQRPTSAPRGWLKLGAVAATSALAGGLAAAWWYRNILKKLRQADESAPSPHYGISGDDSAD